MIRAVQQVVAVRGAGEDRAAIVDDEAGVVLVVADGAGGTGGGAEAADAVIARVREAAAGLAGGTVDPSWLLAELDGALARSRHGGQTTAVLVVVRAGGRVVGASVGDSEAWIVREGAIVDLTKGQKRKPLLGSGGAEVFAFGSKKLEGVLVVGSDGLFKYAKGRERIAGAARTVALDELPGRLVQMVRLADGTAQDDVAVIACAAV